MKICPSCKATYPTTAERCERDGSWLILPEASHDPSDGYLGRVINRQYQILGKLGAGSVGAVFRAMDLKHHDQVALKILNPSADYGDPKAARRLRREARAARKLSHPNVVMVHDFGETEDGVPFLVMELVEGEGLGVLLQRVGRLSSGQAIHIADQVAASLDHAHGRGIVHRDLKPENIQLTFGDGRNDIVKVLDFGLVKLLQTEDGMEPTQLTAQDLILGTPHYMAPEQVRGGHIGPTTDLYALGVLIYRMTTGTLPFQGDNLIVVMQAQVTQRPSPPSALVSDYPPALESLVLDLLEKDPKDRPASADDVRARLNAPELRRLRDKTAPLPLDPAEVANPTTPPPRARSASSRRRSASQPALPPAYTPPGNRIEAHLWWMVGASWATAVTTIIIIYFILSR